MDEHSSSHLKKVGLPPGSMVYVGDDKNTKVNMTEFSFSKTNIIKNELAHISDCKSCTNKKLTTWVNVDGVHDTNIIKSIGNHFNLDSLLMEDIVNTKHRPKEEEFVNCLFLSLKILSVDREKKSINYEQLSLVLGKDYLLSFQENEGGIFRAFKEKIEMSRGIIREKGEDYVFYRLIDTIVDNYFVVIEHINDAVNNLEERILDNAKKDTYNEIFALKKELNQLKRYILPLREAISSIIRNDNNFIHESTDKYFRDLNDHIIQASETINEQNDTIAAFVDLYMTIVSTRMNEVMKVLTMFASVFIPLTFFAGVYGMNFDNMPELHWKYGYMMVWGIMAIITLGFLIFFKRKKWL